MGRGNVVPSVEKPLRRRPLALVVGLLLAGVVPALGGEPREMILVYPGKPGSAGEARNVLKTFTEYLDGHAGWGQGGLNADYFNDEKAALDHIQNKGKPAFAILSLGIYLKWKKQGHALA